MEALSPWHVVIVAIVAAVLFFGWRQLPDMTRSLGRSLRIFNAEIKGVTEDAVRASGEVATAVTAPVSPGPRPVPASEAP